jgi:hypothetical protein
MTITIIQRLWKEGGKKKKIEGACGHKAVKGSHQEKKHLLWKCLWSCGTLKF